MSNSLENVAEKYLATKKTLIRNLQGIQINRHQVDCLGQHPIETRLEKAVLSPRHLCAKEPVRT